MLFSVSRKNHILQGHITLPGSKSESNRALIIRALCAKPFPIENISAADDTQLLINTLSALHSSLSSSLSAPRIIDAGNAGTAFRFLAAFLSCQKGEYLLTGDVRMKQRPVGGLVDALRSLGADIAFTEQKGYPPLKIRGGVLRGGSLTMDGSVSSQFISALLLIAPCLAGGLQLKVKAPVVSFPYTGMTLAMMKRFGAEHSLRMEKDDLVITVPPGRYRPGPCRIEPDWSAASYWYEAAALSDEADILLPGLVKDSLQGDAAIEKIMEDFGVKTIFSEEGARLVKQQGTTLTGSLELDCSGFPDLVPALAVTCAAAGVKATLRGLGHLKIKESDRMAAIISELKKSGYGAAETPVGTLAVAHAVAPNDAPLISTYADHRIAMAFAMLAMKKQEVRIEDPGVVSKSYPEFWEDLRSAGFGVKEMVNC